MPPARNRAAQEDSKAEGTNSKERGTGGVTGKGKKAAAAAAQAANNKDIGSAANNSTITSQTGNACVCPRNC